MANADLPFAFGGAGQLSLNHSNKCTAGVVECLGQFEDRTKRRLLLAEFEDADVSTAKFCLKAKCLLRQARLLAQLTKNFAKGNCWLQVSLLLLEELGRKRNIVSSYSYRKCMMAKTTKYLLKESWVALNAEGAYSHQFSSAKGKEIMRGTSAVIACVLSVTMSGPAYADFLAVGPLKSSSCSNYILFGSCKTVTVDAVEVDGRLYEPRRHFQEVTSYDEEKSSCSVRVSRSTGLSITGAVAKALTEPTFLTKTSTGFEKIKNIEYMSFKCRRVY